MPPAQPYVVSSVSPGFCAWWAARDQTRELFNCVLNLRDC